MHVLILVSFLQRASSSDFLSREDFIHDENKSCLDHRTKQAGHRKQISDTGLMSGVQSQSSGMYQENKVMGSVIVEDVTDSIPTDIPSSPPIVPRVQDDNSDWYPSPRGAELSSSNHPGFDSEVIF